MHSTGHRARIAHRDVKPENICIHANGHAVLCDFSSAHDFVLQQTNLAVERAIAEAAAKDMPEKAARDFIASAAAASSAQGVPEDSGPDEVSDTAGTPAYLSPEAAGVASGGHSPYAADIWALGVTVYVLLCGRLPFGAPGMPALDLYDSIAACDEPLTVPGDFSAGAQSLVHAMTQPNPTERISASAALEHPWLGIAVPPKLSAMSASVLPAWSRIATSSMLAPGSLAFGSDGHERARSRRSSKIAPSPELPSPRTSPPELTPAAAGPGPPVLRVAPAMVCPAPISGDVFTEPLEHAPPGMQSVVAHGWLTKRGRLRKSWARRYFVLGKTSHNKHVLAYYTDVPGRDAEELQRGMIELHGMCFHVNLRAHPPRACMWGRSRGPSVPMETGALVHTRTLLASCCSSPAHSWADFEPGSAAQFPMCVCNESRQLHLRAPTESARTAWLHVLGACIEGMGEVASAAAASAREARLGSEQGIAAAAAGTQCIYNV